MRGNIQLFSVYAAMVLDELFESFPIPATVRASALIRRPQLARLETQVSLSSEVSVDEVMPPEEGLVRIDVRGELAVGDALPPVAGGESGSSMVDLGGARGAEYDAWLLKQRIVAEMIRMLIQRAYLECREIGSETLHLEGTAAPPHDYQDTVFQDCLLTAEAMSRLQMPLQSWGMARGDAGSMIDALQSRVLNNVVDNTLTRLIFAFISPAA